MIRHSLWLAAFLLFALAMSASAHLGPRILIPRLPDPDRMTIDGKDDDWDWYDERLVNRSSDMTFVGKLYGYYDERPAAEIDPEDFHAEFKIAWSAPPDNRLYFFIRVKDDYLQVPDSLTWDDDMFQITIDADHSGGWIGKEMEEVENGQRYRFRVLPAEGEFVVDANERDERPEISWSGAWFEDEKTEWFDAAWSLDPPDARDGSRDVTYTFEFSCALWDLHGPTAALSQRHVFAPGQVIHLGPRPTDADEGIAEKHLLHYSGGHFQQDRSADLMVDHLVIESLADLGRNIGYSEAHRRFSAVGRGTGAIDGRDGPNLSRGSGRFERRVRIQQSPSWHVSGSGRA